jgi:ABC-type glycerol-3-phosphate transport system substrate-binding protein
MACISAAIVVSSVSAGRREIAAPRSVTIRITTDNGWAFIPPAAQQFEKQHPGVKIVQTSLTFQTDSAYFANLARNLAAPGAPDITTVRVEPGPWDAVVQRHLVVPLTNVWAQQKLAKAYSPAAVRILTAPDHNHYAIAIDRWWPVVWYSKTAFSKAGITAPANGRVATQAQLLQWGTALKKAGYPVPMAVGTTDEQSGAYIFGQLLQSSCGNTKLVNLDNNWKKSVPVTTTWTDPCVMRALQATKVYQTSGLLGPAPSTESDEQAQTYFGKGKAGMYITGSWGQAEFEGNHFTLPFGWFILPPVPGGHATQPLEASYDGLAVVSSSRNKKLAEQFLALIASKQFMGSSGYASTFTLAPARTDVSIKSPPFPSDIGQMVNVFPKLGGTVSLPYTTVPWGATVTPTIASMWSGSKSVREVANSFARAAANARRS